MRDAPTVSFREFRRRSLWLIWIALVFLFVWVAWRLLFLAFAGFLLAIILRTFADWFESHTALGPRWSYTATIASLACLGGLMAWLIVPNVINQGAQLANIVPVSLRQAKDYLDHFTWGHYIARMVSHSTEGLQLTHIADMMIHLAVAMIVIVVVGFYAGLNPQGYSDAILSLVPKEHRAEAAHVATEVIYTLRWWLLGQLVPMIVLGLMSMIGLWLLGVPLAFTLGLITGAMIFVPYLGTLLAEIPAVLVALKISPMKAVYVIILYLAVHLLEGYILTPLVQKRAVRLLPILTVLSQLLMGILTGLLGVAIATPLAATGLVLVKMLYLHEEIDHDRAHAFSQLHS